MFYTGSRWKNSRFTTLAYWIAILLKTWIQDEKKKLKKIQENFLTAHNVYDKMIEMKGGEDMMSTGKIISAISICFVLVMLCLPLVVSGKDVKITNIEVGSGKGYKVGDGPFDLNKKYYIDRDYIATSMPDEIEGAQWIMTANDDKNSTGDDFLTFEIDSAAVVWVAHDSRGEEEKGGVPPTWLADNFEHHPDLKIDVTDTNMGFFTLWEKEFQKGTVTLGGNADPPAAGQGSNYIVLITPGTAQSVKLQGKLGATWAKIKE